MRAVLYDEYSQDLSTLSVRELPTPKVGPGSVLIQVRAAGVNPVDWCLMAGDLDSLMDARFPVVPGWDVAGVVVAVGIDTPEFSVGDEVMAYASKETVHGGTFAEFVAVTAQAVARKPAPLSWEQAGGLPVAGLAAQRALDTLGDLADRTLLVHGAAGGVGSLAVQIGVARGARVLGTASEKNFEFLRSLGAEPVAYGEGVVERVRDAAGGVVDAVADFVGGQLETTLAVLADGGPHVSIADDQVQAHGGRYVWIRPDGQETARLAALAEAGSLRVEVTGSFGLEQVAQAFEQSQSGHVRGKLVIVP